jgi:phage tail P2-like protein
MGTAEYTINETPTHSTIKPVGIGTYIIGNHIILQEEVSTYFSYVPQIKPFAPPTYLQEYLYQSAGVEDREEHVFVTGGAFELQEEAIVWYEQNKYDATVEVSKDRCVLYRKGNKLLKYLPEEFSVLDEKDDLKQFLETVAFSMDEFYCFIKDFTTIFDPDTCGEKYLKYLAILINYPLNTRGFDSTVPSVQEAAIRRARIQLKEAVEVYKRKGIKEAFQILLYSLGYYIELVELWTTNYISFHEEVPTAEFMYNPVTNPTGWFKSPYFGIRLISVNQSTVCTTGGEGQPWSFDEEDFKGLLEAVHRIRPVHTVLWWIEYYMDLCDIYTFIDEPSNGEIIGVPEDKFFLDCEPDDPTYYRGDLTDIYNPNVGDPRLALVTRDSAPNEGDLTLPGEAVGLVNLVRDPQPGLCSPTETFEIGISDINWADEPWCTQVFRNCGLLYRDGYNMNPRDGSVPTRDPSCFDGRNGGYWRGEEVAGPYAPYTEGVENGLVPSRIGCYTTDDHLVPLYQVAEEYEDGIVKYYNLHEFKTYLDSVVLGPGPDPPIEGDPTDVPDVIFSQASVALRSVFVPYMLDDYAGSIWSALGTGSAPAYNGTWDMTKIAFASGAVSSVQTIAPILSGVSVEGLRRGAAASNGINFYFMLGETQDSPGGAWAQNDKVFKYSIDDNEVTQLMSTGNYAIGAAYAQAGDDLFIFSGVGEDPPASIQATYYKFNTTSELISGPFAMPAGCARSYGCAVASNEYIYLYGGSGSGGINTTLYRFHTVTETFTLVDTLSTAAPTQYGIIKNNVLYFYADEGLWDDPSWEYDDYLRYNLVNNTYISLKMARPSSKSSVQPISQAGRFFAVGGAYSAAATNDEIEQIQITG